MTARSPRRCLRTNLFTARTVSLTMNVVAPTPMSLPFTIDIASTLTGRVDAAGGFAGEDFAPGERTIDNGTVAGVVPSLASTSGEQVLSFGSYTVSPEGVVTLTLGVGNETITGEGAVTGDGDFVAVVTGSTTTGAERSGRSILFLMRQPD